MRLVISAQSLEKFVEDLNKLMSKGVVDTRRYVVCIGISGVVLLPTVTSRHRHTVQIIGLDDLETFSKAVEELRKRGFDVVERCTAYPDSG